MPPGSAACRKHMIPVRFGWTSLLFRFAEIAAREARYTLKENELLAEMFVLAERGILEEVHRSLRLEEDEEWANGLLRYIMEHL